VWDTSHSLRILLIVATRGTCQPQSHDARLAADPWVTTKRRRRVPLAGGLRGTAVSGLRFGARARRRPLFPFHFARTYPGRPGSPSSPPPPSHCLPPPHPHPTTHKPALESRSRGSFNNIIIDITDDFTHVGQRAGGGWGKSSRTHT